MPHVKTEWDLRQDVVAVGRRMYERGLIAATDGNISVRLSDDALLVTPSGVCKGDLAPDDLLKTDLAGRPKGPGGGRPSSEIRMHLAVYRVRPDVRAVCHAHPPATIAFSLAGLTLAECLLPEVILAMGAIPTAPYATPTTDEVPRSIERLIRGCDALILERHGSLTVGRDLWAAFHHLDRMEHAALVTLHARSLGPLTPLSPDLVARLAEARRTLGLSGPAPACER